MSDPDKTPPQGWGMRELLRDQAGIPSDSPTLVPCDRCHGNGRRTEVLQGDGENTYSTLTEREPCWLCEGVGATAGKSLARWRSFGGPVEMPVDWLSRP